MTSHDHLHAVQQEIKKVGAQIDKADGDLAKARADTDNKEGDFLRNSLVELRKEKNSMLEQESILLRAQAPGQHCLPSHSWLKVYTLFVHIMSGLIFHIVLSPGREEA